MKHFLSLAGYGVLLWLIVFVSAMMMFKLRTDDLPLFESLIAVALATATSVVSILYFRGISQNFFAAGIRAGLIWMLVNLAIDLPMFSAGPMKMPLLDYFKDIGFTYLMIPEITITFGFLLEKKILQK